MLPSPTTLPASWYCSKELQELERRAVFQRSWYFLGTVTKFKDEHDEHFEIAQVSLTVNTTTVSENKKQIRVVDDETNSELQSHQTSTGLIFTTISSAAPSFEEFFPGLEDLLKSYDFTQMPHRKGISYEGKYNWKTLIDGFQECLHCQYTHPSFCERYPTTSYAVVNHGNWSRHFSDPKRPDDGLFLYFFPIGTLNLYNGGMSSFRACPGVQPGVTRMEFDYYNELTGADFAKYYQFVRQVANEDHDLCEGVQGNLEKAIYSRGILNPLKEAGVASYQQRVFEMVAAQHAMDKDDTDNKQSSSYASYTRLCT